MCLSDLHRGQTATVVQIPDDDLRMQLMRFGVTAGCLVRCHTKVPFGPVVVRYGGQEIAVGRRVAERIRVESGGEVTGDGPRGRG